MFHTFTCGLGLAVALACNQESVSHCSQNGAVAVSGLKLMLSTKLKRRVVIEKDFSISLLSSVEGTSLMNELGLKMNNWMLDDKDGQLREYKYTGWHVNGDGVLVHTFHPILGSVEVLKLTENELRSRFPSPKAPAPAKDDGLKMKNLLPETVEFFKTQTKLNI